MINTRNAGLLLGLGVLGAFAAAPASAQVVISQLYGGGGNSGATITNDFVELFNNGATPFSLAGTSLQYASATGVFSNKLDLTGTVQPGRFFLIKLAQGAGGTSFSVTPDQDGSGVSTPITMAAAAGKVAFVNSTTLLASTVASQPGLVFDFVGYGATASTFEGTGRAPAPSNTTSIARNFAAFKAVDTNNNSLDFTAGAPTLRNSSTLAPVPAPSSVAVMALGGLMPMIAIARRRRATK